MDFSMTFLGLTKPYRESRIAACSSISQRNNGDVAAGSQNWGHEVEVPPGERGANPSGQLLGKNRIDQRMPLEFVTDSFLPSKTSVRSNKQNSVAQCRKPGGNDRDKTGAVNQAWIDLHGWCKVMEGQFYLIAIAID